MKKKFRLITSIILASSIIIGAFIVSKLNVNEQIYSEEEIKNIFLNDVVEMPKIKLTHQDEEAIVDGKVIFPSGSTYTGKSFTAKEHGLYRVVYEKYFGHEKVEKTFKYLCQRRSEDYFRFNETVKSSYGDFRYNDRKNHHSGVILDVENGATITFNEPLDMKDFMVEQKPEPGEPENNPISSMNITAKSLIDFVIDPTTQGKYDFSSLLIRLTDVDDARNYVDIRFRQYFDANDPRAPMVSYVRSGASCNFIAGWEFGWKGADGVYNPGHYHTGSGGTGIALSFYGTPYEGFIHSSQILFDYANYRLYTYPGSLSHSQAFFNNDLDNYELYRNNGWTGFKNDKCYLSITPFDFYQKSGRILIKSVGKYSFDKEIITDNEAPSINVDLKGHKMNNLPKAMMGMEYPIFPAEVIDNLDSNLTPRISVLYHDTEKNQDIDVNVRNNKFFVNKEGTYVIKYDAIDRSGNKAHSVSIPIQTVNHLEKVQLNCNVTVPDSVVFDTINLPTINDITSTGGSGIINIERKLFNPKGEEIIIDNNSFKPTDIGTYQVVFYGQDYLGNTGTLYLPFDVSGLDKPIFLENINLPPVLIKGFTYHFDKVRTVESVNGKNIEGKSIIKVDGNLYNDSYIPNGNEVVIEYIAKGDKGDTIETFNIPVIDPNGSDNKLNEANFFYGNADKVVNKDDITISFDQETSLTFANKLDSSNLTVGLEMDEEMNKFNTVEFKLIDVNNSNIHITFSLNIPNKKLLMPGYNELDFTFYKQEIIFQYKDNSFGVYDTNNNLIATCFIDDDNQDFNGFKDGVYLVLSFKDIIASSKIKLTKMNNHNLGFKNNSGDKIGPSLRLSDEFMPVQQYGEILYYPTFKAYDVFSEIASETIRITDPNGEVYSGDGNFKVELKIDTFGSYSVSYLASDKRGNPSRLTHVAFVYDNIKPTLDVDKLNKLEYHVGDIFKIPGYRVSDNLDNVTVDVILIMPNNEMRILTHDENGEITYALIDNSIYNSSFIVDKNSFRIEEKGAYRLRYVAYDEEFNTVVVEYDFNAK